MVNKIFLLIGALVWYLSLSAADVLRLVPIEGAAQDVPVASLRKVVLTTDSIVFVPKVPNSIQNSDGRSQNSAVYKYDYSTMLFVAAEPTAVERAGVSESRESVKFIQDGRLYIRRDNKIYDIFGTSKTIQN